jgi:hypothetical protein
MKKISSISSKACLLVASVLCSIPAFPVFADPCNASKELDEQILKCGDNALAPKFGRECLAIIKKESEVAHATLQKAQASRDRRKLEEAINNMFEQIKTMQSQTANVADYAGLMIDFPDSYRKETSAECFNTNFDELQKIVNDMDDEIIRAKKAYETSKKLHNR